MTILPSPIPHPFDFSPWDLPDWAYTALEWAVGFDWPEGNEKTTWDIADQWYEITSTLAGPRDESYAAAAEVIGAYGGSGVTIDAFAAAWDKISQGTDAPLNSLLEFADEMGKMVESCGCDIEGAKIEAWIELGLFVIELIGLAVTVALTLGAASPAAGGLIAATRYAIQQIFKRLLAQLSKKALKATLKEAGKRAAKQLTTKAGLRKLGKEALEEGFDEAREEFATNLGIQAYQNTTGRRDGIDGSDLAWSTAAGAAGGAAASGAHIGAGHGNNSLLRGAAAEVLGEFGGAAATGNLPTSFESVAKSAVSGASGSAISGARGDFSNLDLSSLDGGVPTLPSGLSGDVRLPSSAADPVVSPAGDYAGGGSSPASSSPASSSPASPVSYASGNDSPTSSPSASAPASSLPASSAASHSAASPAAPASTPVSHTAASAVSTASAPAVGIATDAGPVQVNATVASDGGVSAATDPIAHATPSDTGVSLSSIAPPMDAPAGHVDTGPAPASSPLSTSTPSSPGSVTTNPTTATPSAGPAGSLPNSPLNASPLAGGPMISGPLPSPANSSPSLSTVNSPQNLTTNPTTGGPQSPGGPLTNPAGTPPNTSTTGAAPNGGVRPDLTPRSSAPLVIAPLSSPGPSATSPRDVAPIRTNPSSITAPANPAPPGNPSVPSSPSSAPPANQSPPVRPASPADTPLTNPRADGVRPDPSGPFIGTAPPGAPGAPGQNGRTPQQDLAERQYFDASANTQLTVYPDALNAERKRLDSALYQNRYDQGVALSSRNYAVQVGDLVTARDQQQELDELRQTAGKLQQDRQNVENPNSGYEFRLTAQDHTRANADLGQLAAGPVQTTERSALTGNGHPPSAASLRNYYHEGGLRPPLSQHQVDLELAMPRDANGDPMRAVDPRTGGYRHLINDGGPTADPTRGNNCLDCSLSFFDTYVHGRPRVAAPRTFDSYVVGHPTIQMNGEAEGPRRAELAMNSWHTEITPWVGNKAVAQAKAEVDQGFNALHQTLLNGGPGSCAVVITYWEGGGGHAWNAVNHNGTILYLDTQTNQLVDSSQPAQGAVRTLYGHHGVSQDNNVVQLAAIMVDGQGNPMFVPNTNLVQGSLRATHPVVVPQPPVQPVVQTQINQQPPPGPPHMPPVQQSQPVQPISDDVSLSFTEPTVERPAPLSDLDRLSVLDPQPRDQADRIRMALAPDAPAPDPGPSTKPDAGAREVAEAEARATYQYALNQQRAEFAENHRQELGRDLRRESVREEEVAENLSRQASLAFGDGQDANGERYRALSDVALEASADLRDQAIAVERGTAPVGDVEVDGPEWHRVNEDPGDLAPGPVETDDRSALTGDDRPRPVDMSRRYNERGGLRPPLAVHQTDLERAMPRDAEGRVLRQADPRDGEWFGLMNDGGPEVDPTRSINCGDTVLSLYETYVHGRPRVSAPRTFDGYHDGDPDRPMGAERNVLSRIQATTGGRFQGLCPDVSDLDPQDARQAVQLAQRNLHNHLLNSGHGSFAFVTTRSEGGRTHAFAAVNQNGTIVYLDPQVRRVSDTGPLYSHNGNVDSGNVTVMDALVVTGDGQYSPLPYHDAGPFSTAEPEGTRRDQRYRHSHPEEFPRPPERTPDSFLPGGEPVYYRPNATAIGYDAATMSNFDHAKPVPGHHDVVVHGKPDGKFIPGLVRADGEIGFSNDTNAGHIADAIRHNPHWDGGPVRLISCHSARLDKEFLLPEGLKEFEGFSAAQRVADALGVRVLAPTQPVGVPNRGGDERPVIIFKDGTWESFRPGGGKR
ncbi:toxin glutamine deamidase domain-containing protein [Actinoplanes sp. NPDC051494]|uniref:toxin glutamine deamidase domain-containing protein n=1 Tax=Actinoplanes sp. NPDC051494 TaxID=3363907 RepID=UPI00378C111A